MISAQPSSPWRADLALAFIALIWGSTFVLVKEALEDISSLLFLAIRFSLAAVALAAAFRGRYGSASGQKPLWPGVVAGTFLFSGYMFQTVGLKYTTASKSAFITGLSIVMVPLFASLVYKEAPHLSEWLGVVVAATGLALLTLPAGEFRIGLGDGLTAICAVVFAVHIVLMGLYSPRIGVENLSMIQVATAAVLSLGTFWWAETPRVKWTTVLVVALVVTALLATALAFTVQAWAQQRTTATHAALIFALEPVFAWITSYLVAAEMLSARAAAGAVTILGGILIVELKPVRRRRRPPC
jgi:drug/metabolite transporter (DMT)-like permease